jgi:hypothetical protein
MVAQRISGEAPWRRSRIVQGVASPAAGADWSTTVPAGHLWQPFSVTAQLVTSAVVANRQAVLVLGDGTNIYAYLTAPAVQAASATVIYTWANVDTFVALGSRQVAALPDVSIPPGWTIGVVTSALDVGDAWTAIRLGLIDTTERWGKLELAGDPDAVFIVGADAPPG